MRSPFLGVVVLWALVMGPFDSDGVCAMGPDFEDGISTCWGQTGGPYQAHIRTS